MHCLAHRNALARIAKTSDITGCEISALMWSLFDEMASYPRRIGHCPTSVRLMLNISAFWDTCLLCSRCDMSHAMIMPSAADVLKIDAPASICIGFFTVHLQVPAEGRSCKELLGVGEGDTVL